jgi:lipoprotein-releasing system permease protein|tara:strand:+ start:558 stop:1790 length:1233 start_codon:yes stop_codon:yes gene_type:complete
MQLGYYIAKKLSFSKQQSFTKTITVLAIAAVSISVCVVILAFGILLGFKKEIRAKVRGYAGDISISRYQLADGSESNLFTIDSAFLAKAKNTPGVETVFPFINKTGILKSDSTLEGIMFKAVPDNYDFSFYQKHLKRGKIPHYTDSTDSYDILLSEYTATIMGLDTGDNLNLYFLDNTDVRRRRPKVAGIFNTGLQEFDKKFAIAHIRSIQRIVTSDYQTAYTKAAGYEVRIADYEKITVTQGSMSFLLDYNYAISTIEELNPIMFQWLDIVDNNVIVIIVLMLIVAIINIITVLLILIIDRIPMIGLLKSMGSTSGKIMSIFHWQGLFILFGGLLVGNAMALSAGYLQVNYKLIGLDADTYYMDAVPFTLPFTYLLLINLGALAVCFVFTYIPVRMVSGIQPSDSIKFR